MTRHPTAPLPLIALLSTLALAGCSKMTDTKKLDPAKDAAGFVQAYIDLASQYVARCYGFSQAEKEAFYQQNLFQFEEQVRASQAGRQGYDKALASSCLAAIADLKCGQDPPADCQDLSKVLPPLVPVNGACTGWHECKSPAVACYTGALGATCPGQCLAAGTAGAQCYGPNNLPGCATGYWCSGYTSSVAGTCTANVGWGADCSVASCSANLFCHFISGSYTCDYFHSQGQSCGDSANYQCAAGLYCDYTAQLCKSYVSVGNACNTSASVYCESSLYCDSATSTCKVYPTAPAPIGASCVSPCYCDQTVAFKDASNVCRAYLAKGASCNNYSQCGFAAICQGLAGGASSGTCAALGDVGAPCHTGWSECLQGLTCGAPAGSATGTPGTCRAAPGLGGTCGTVNTGEYADCLTNQCDYGSPPAPTGTCVAYKGLGQDCSRLACDPYQYLECSPSSYCQAATSCHP